MSVQLAQIINFLLLLIPVALLTFLVTWEGRKRGLSGWETLGWIFVSLLFFPIGLLLFLLIRKGPSRS